MTSMLGGNIMHLAATQLVAPQKEDDNDNGNVYGGLSPSPSYEQQSTPPQHDEEQPSEQQQQQTQQQLTFDLLKENGIVLQHLAEQVQQQNGQSIGTFPFCLQPSDVANSDTASSESPEPGHHDTEELSALELQQAVSLINSFGKPVKQEEDTEATIRDLMPVLAAANNASGTNTSSPSAWARNAGRKKSHPVWEFFKDLKDSTGSGGVICLHCSWNGDDRSPNNLRTHLKKFHTDDGIFARFSLKLASTPTQPYVKRVRGGAIGSSASSSTLTEMKPSMVLMDQKPILDSMTFALQQLQQSGSLNDFGTTLNFLDSLPKSSEVINISGGYHGAQEGEEENENHAEAASSSSSDEPIRHTDSPTIDGRSSNSPSKMEQLNGGPDLAAFVNNLASANPMMLAMLNASGQQSMISNGQLIPPSRDTNSTSPQPPTLSKEKDPSSFSLSDGPCAAILMSMALDLDMTMSYHRRRVDIELCFESNRTAEKSGGRGKVICLTDLGKEIKIVERVNGAVTDTELWTKTDFNQFHWAIRGKCQKCFNKQ